jgi:hypothetical protein
MLPDANDQPAGISQELVLLSIPSGVALKLGGPESSVRDRYLAMLGTSVPEAAIDKYRDATARERYVRPDELASDPDRKILAISVACRVQCAA